MIDISPYPQPHAPQLRPVSPVVVYGRRWCALSQMVRRYLDRASIPYDYVDLDTNRTRKRSSPG